MSLNINNSKILIANFQKNDQNVQMVKSMDSF